MRVNHHSHTGPAGPHGNQAKLSFDQILVSEVGMALPRTGRMGMEPSFHVLIDFLH
jgi:hypothetical protein